MKKKKILFVTNQRDNSISIINLKKFEVTKTLEDVCEYPEGIDISYNENLIVVACWFEDNIILLDLDSYKLIKKLKYLEDPDHLEILYWKTMNNKDLKLMSNAIRALSIDAIEKANSGHPGMPLGMADVATVLFTKFLKFDPSDPNWIDRDRFVLSAGHGSMLLYAISHLVGYKDSSIEQIKNFRQLGSKTAGHPEFGLLKCIETTTGPLGQGLGNAVGMAIAENILNQKYGNLINHKTYVIAGDGCLMEGISHEAISIAGHMRLKNLIVFFDDNKISIDGSVNLTCSDDQRKRFVASNWNTVDVNAHSFESIEKGIKNAIKSDKPTLILCKSTIGYGSPNKSGKETAHGSPLGNEESKLTKENLNWNYKKFEIPRTIKNKWLKIGLKEKQKELLGKKIRKI